MSNISDFIGGAPQKWVTGTAYNEGKVVWSPVDYQYFMRKTAGAGSTDPSADTTNWQPTGERAAKSIQRGSISLASGTTTISTTISSVNPLKCELYNLGFSGQPGETNFGAALSIPNATTITATKSRSDVSTGSVGWQLIERY